MSHFLPRLHARTALLVLISALLTWAPAAHAASSISSVTFDGDVVLDKTAVMTIGGFLDPADDSIVTLGIHANPPSLPCAVTSTVNRERNVDFGTTTIRAGAFTQAVNWKARAAGDFTLCLYLNEYGVNYATSSRPLAVRQPKVALRLSLPRQRFKPLAVAPLTIRASAEVARALYVERNPLSMRCAPNPLANDGAIEVYNDGVLADVAPFTRNISVGQPGRYHLCGYLMRDSLTATADLVVDGPNFVSGAVPSCRVRATVIKRQSQLVLACQKVSGSITVGVERPGQRTVKRARTLQRGRLTFPAAALKLRRGERATISVTRGHATLERRLITIR